MGRKRKAPPPRFVTVVADRPEAAAGRNEKLREIAWRDKEKRGCKRRRDRFRAAAFAIDQGNAANPSRIVLEKASGQMVSDRLMPAKVRDRIAIIDRARTYAIAAGDKSCRNDR
jgi:hypothetical protein